MSRILIRLTEVNCTDLYTTYQYVVQISRLYYLVSIHINKRFKNMKQLKARRKILSQSAVKNYMENTYSKLHKKM